MSTDTPTAGPPQPVAGNDGLIDNLRAAARDVLNTTGPGWIYRIAASGDQITNRFVRLCSPSVVAMLADEVLTRRVAATQLQARYATLSNEHAELERRYAIAINALARARSAAPLQVAERAAA